MRDFKCCLDCEWRCENCHANCQPYKKEKTIHDLMTKHKRNKQKQDLEYSGYEKEKRNKIEKASKRKHR